VAQLPVSTCGEDLESNRLCVIAPGWAPPLISLYALYPSRRDLTLAGRRFLELLCEASVALGRAA
jgi:DNA-binding transcriptional LysR family regulator